LQLGPLRLPDDPTFQAMTLKREKRPDNTPPCKAGVNLRF